MLCLLLSPLLPVRMRVQGLFKSVGGGKLVPHVTELLEVNAVLVDLHGYSCWTGQLAVLYVLQGLLKQYQWSKPRRRMAPGLRVREGTTRGCTDACWDVELSGGGGFASDLV